MSQSGYIAYSDGKTKQSSNLIHLGLLLGIVVVGAGIRLYRLGGNLYSDEVWIVTTAVSPFPVFIQEFLGDWVHPPLFHFLARAWVFLFGFSDISGRLLAVTFGILSIPLIYWLGKLVSGPKTGLVAAVLLALSPTHIFHSQYGRHYSLFVFTVLLSMIAFSRLVSQSADKKNSIFYILSTILMVYTHYFGWLIYFCQFLFFLFLRFSNARHWVVLQVVILLSYLPWVVVVLNIAPETANSFEHLVPHSSELLVPHIAWIEKPSWLEPVQTIATFNGSIPGPHMTKLGLLILGGIFFLSIFATRNDGKTNRDLALFILSCVVVPFGLVFFVSYTIQPIWILRAMLLCLAPYYLTISIGTQLVERKPISWILIVIPIIWMSVASWSYFQNEHRMPYEKIAQYLGKEAQKGIPILVENTYLMNPLFHYYKGQATLYELSENNVSIVPGSQKCNLFGILEERRNKGDSLILVTYTSAEKYIRNQIPSSYRFVKHKEFSGNGEEGQIRKVQVFFYEKT